MGWCSGTDVFDPVVATVLETDIPEGAKREIIKSLIDALEDGDWDCQDDSFYMDNPIVRSVMRELHPSWFEDEC